jgi:2'-5' RNA ligase
VQLHAVIIPPPGVVEDAAEAARELVAAQLPKADEGRPGLLARLRRRPADPAPTVSIALADPGALFVRLAKFGNVTSSDATNLADDLRGVAATWAAPRLHVSRVTVGQGRPIEVAALLEGDVDALTAIFRNLNDAAKRQGFFLDRRNFRSELRLGEVEVPDGAVVPDALEGAAADVHGPEWQPTHISFLRSVHRGDGPAYEEIHRLPLAVGASA